MSNGANNLLVIVAVVAWRLGESPLVAERYPLLAEICVALALALALVADKGKLADSVRRAMRRKPTLFPSPSEEETPVDNPQRRRR